MLCPCSSGKSYQQCCKKYHEGVFAENALSLMKSRYSAYALSCVSYIIETTHPQSSQYKKNKKNWEHEIELFSKNTVFHKLEIIEFIDGEQKAFVTFKAHLSQNGADVSFTEKSLFEKYQGRWLYKEGIFLKKN